jgi:hypothetical protein
MKTDLNILLKGLAEVRARQIYLTKFSIETENIYDDAYAFAVCKSIYPLFHEERYMETDEEVYKLKLPFYETYELTENTISEFAEFLDQNWLNKKYFTFYQLEGHYRNSWTGNDLRSDLINCLRYFFLQHLFDKPFWDTILKPMEYPIEADRITRPFEKTELY